MKMKDKFEEFRKIRHFPEYTELVTLYMIVGILEEPFEEVEYHKDIYDKYLELQALIHEKIDEMGNREVE